MVLLDVVRRLPGVHLIVAHVNHGIRNDAPQDAQLVRHYSMSHNLKYEETNLQLGNKASEEAARTARYDFLRHISEKYNACAIITAHHKNDVIETAIINLLRGTGWRGLSALRSTSDTVRPFLHVAKAELQEYAAQHNVPWRHDTTNDDTTYLRNYVRHKILPRMAIVQQQKLYEYIVRQSILTDAIDNEAAAWLQAHAHFDHAAVTLPRYPLIMMPEHVVHELLQGVLRRASGKSATRPQVKRMQLFIKVAKSLQTFPLNAEWQLRALPREVIVERR